MNKTWLDWVPVEFRINMFKKHSRELQQGYDVYDPSSGEEGSNQMEIVDFDRFPVEEHNTLKEKFHQRQGGTQIIGFCFSWACLYIAH